MLTLNIIGAGRLGQTLGRLWHAAGVCTVHTIMNRSRSSAESAADFVGAGRPVSSYAELGQSDVTLIAVSDDAIRGVCEALVRHRALAPGSIVFHCSGGLSSEILAAALDVGARTASVHPVKSFAEPSLAVASFAGTYCGMEGDPESLRLLKKWFGEVGARCFDVDPRYKTHYHAASVMVCNYLVSLMELGFQLYERAGVTRSLAAALVQPIMQQTLDNVLELGTTEALTGPIARGDREMVARHLDALSTDAPHIARVYGELGLIAAALARESRRTQRVDLDALEQLLRAVISRQEEGPG